MIEKKGAMQAVSMGDCPGCGRGIAASLDMGAMLHELPQCSDFRSRDPVAFAKWVNDKRGRPS